MVRIFSFSAGFSGRKVILRKRGRWTIGKRTDARINPNSNYSPSLARLLTTKNSRLFPFQVSASSLALLFLFIMLVTISQRQLTPGIVLIGSFILFTLWLTGLIQIAITLYGPRGSVNTYCNQYQPSRGVSQQTLAWLETNMICESRPLVPFTMDFLGEVQQNMKRDQALQNIRLRYHRLTGCVWILGMDWRAAFALQLVGVIFFLWMIIMAYQVNRDDYE